MSIQSLLRSEEYAEFLDSVIIEDEFQLAVGVRCETVQAALTAEKLVLAQSPRPLTNGAPCSNGRGLVARDLELARLVPLPFLQVCVVDNKQRRIQITLAGSESLYLEHRGDAASWARWESNISSLNSQTDTSPFHIDSRLKSLVQEHKDQHRESRKRKKKRKKEKLITEQTSEEGGRKSRSRARSLPLVPVTMVGGSRSEGGGGLGGKPRASFAAPPEEAIMAEPKIEKWQAQNLTPIGESQDSVSSRPLKPKLSQRFSRYKSKSARHRRLSLSIMDVIMVPTRGRDIKDRRTRSASNLYDDDPHHVCNLYMEEVADTDRDVIIRRRSLPSTLHGNTNFLPDTARGLVSAALPVSAVASTGSSSLLTCTTSSTSASTAAHKLSRLNLDTTEEVCFLHHHPSRKRRHSLLHQSTKKRVHRPSYIRRQHSERRPRGARQQTSGESRPPDSGSRTRPPGGSPRSPDRGSGRDVRGSETRDYPDLSTRDTSESPVVASRSSQTVVCESTSESITAIVNDLVSKSPAKTANGDVRLSAIPPGVLGNQSHVTSDSAASDTPSTPSNKRSKSFLNNFKKLLYRRRRKDELERQASVEPEENSAETGEAGEDLLNIEFEKITVEHTAPRPSESETVRREMIEFVLALKSSVVARELTMIDKKLFFRIPKEELIDCLWTKRNKYQLAPNIMKMIDFFERIANLVATQILLDPNPRGRAKIIAKFIWIAYKCRRLQNFNSMRAIIGGLQLTPVFRLEKTWDYVMHKYPRKYKVYTELSDLMGHEDNFTRYRVMLKKCLLKPPCIPFIGVFLQTVLAVDTVKDVRGYKKKKRNKQSVSSPNQTSQNHETSDKAPLMQTKSNVQVIIHSESDHDHSVTGERRQSIFDQAKSRVQNMFRSESEDRSTGRRQSLLEAAKNRVQGAFRSESQDRSTLSVPTRRLRSRDNKLSSFQLSDSDLSADEDSKPTFLKLKPNDMLFQYQMAALLYSFDSDPVVLDFLLHADYNTDEENYSLSLLREPRNPVQTSTDSSGGSADDER